MRDTLEKRSLGRSEIQVSMMALGCWALVGDTTWGPQDERDSIATVHAALDVGMNFFDTAEMYGDGRSEEIIGKALKGRRSEAVVASKVAARHLGYDDLITACNNSLRRLDTDYIDVYYIHWPNADIPIEESLRALDTLQSQGKIRVAACSNFGVQDLNALLSFGRVEANQLAYSMLFRAIEYDIQQACVDHDIGIVCYSPLAQGLLTGKFLSPDDVPEGRARTRLFSSHRPQARHDEGDREPLVFEAIQALAELCRAHGVGMTEAALAWLLSRPGVSSVVTGARHPNQVIHNAKAVDVNLPPRVYDAMTQLTDPLKQQLGPNADMWQVPSRIR